MFTAVTLADAKRDSEILLRGNGRNNLFGKHVSICPFNQIRIEVPNTQCRTPISRASEHKRGNVADISGVEKAEPDAVVRHIHPCRQQTLFCRSCKIWHYSPGQRIALPLNSPNSALRLRPAENSVRAIFAIEIDLGGSVVVPGEAHTCEALVSGHFKRGQRIIAS